MITIKKVSELNVGDVLVGKRLLVADDGKGRLVVTGIQPEGAGRVRINTRQHFGENGERGYGDSSKLVSPNGRVKVEV